MSHNFLYYNCLAIREIKSANSAAQAALICTNEIVYDKMGLKTKRITSATSKYFWSKVKMENNTKHLQKLITTDPNFGKIKARKQHHSNG